MRWERGAQRAAAWTVWGLVGLGGAGCAPGDDADDDGPITVLPYADPNVPGPYPVGIRTIVLPEVAGYTNVEAEVWYPAAHAGSIKGDYEFIGVTFAAEGYRDAEPEPHALNRLIAFSHGLGGVRQQNYAMAERLASYGFIVIAPDHPGTTTLDYLAGFDNLGPDVLRRPAVIRAAVDAIWGGAVPGLVAVGDTYGLIGHSLGALTAMSVGGGVLSGPGFEATCSPEVHPVACDLLGHVTYDPADVEAYALPDDRVETTILQSPGGTWAFEPGSLAGIPHPLVMGATADTILPYESEIVPVWDAVSGPAAFVTYEGAGHYGYTNMCDLSVATLFAPDCEGAEAGFADPLVIREKANRTVMAWMGATLGGQAAFEEDLGAGDGVEWERK